MSYSGFFVTEEGGLYEVKKAGEEYDELKNAYFVPASELNNYSEDEKFIPQSDPDHPGRTVSRLKHYPRGTFIYRLAGRNRQKSASYYTPEVLTQCVVKYALKELLQDKTADDILQLTICEPAMGSGAFLNEAINQLADAYLKARQLEAGKRLGHDEYGQELQKVKAFIAANNVYGVDLNPVAVELAEVSLWLNTIHPGCPVPWFNMQLAAGNSLIGARRQAFSSHLLRPKRGEKSWLDEVPVRYPLRPAEGEPAERPAHSVYHFLLPDTGMANYNDKVVKQIAGEQLDTIKEWRRAFCKPFENHHVAALERLSAAIDRLWLAHIRDRRKLRDETCDTWDMFGYSAEGAARALTTQEKDRLFNERILSRIDANSSAYRRLKLVMDYWCALWFWPIDKADMLPSREEFLLEIQSIIEGGVIEATLIENDQYVLNLGNAPVQQELDVYQERGYVNLEKLCHDYPRLALVQELAERYRFHHWELEFADLFVERGGFDLVLGNPPWIKISWEEGNVLGDANPRFVFDKTTSSEYSKLRESAFIHNDALQSIYLQEFEFSEATQIYLNSKLNYPILVGIQANLFKCFIPKAWYISNEYGVSSFITDSGIYSDTKGGRFRRACYHRLRYYFVFQNELGLFQDVGNQKRYEIQIFSSPRKEIKFHHIGNLFHPCTVDNCFFHSGLGSIQRIKTDNDKWELSGHYLRIIDVDSGILKVIRDLYDTSNRNIDESVFSSIHAKPIISALEKLSQYSTNLSSIKEKFDSSRIMDESKAQDEGLILKSTGFRFTELETILSGPHIGVANPFFQSPRRICDSHRAYDNISLDSIPIKYIPRSNFTPLISIEKYTNAIPRIKFKKQDNFLDNYRLVHRRRLNAHQERTLQASISPSEVGHIHALISTIFQEYIDLITTAFIMHSLTFDYWLKTTGKSDLTEGSMRHVFFVKDNNSLSFGIIRTLMLNCLTSHYAKLWAECWDPAFHDDKWAKVDPRLTNDRFRNLTPQWVRNSALRKYLTKNFLTKCRIVPHQP